MPRVRLVCDLARFTQGCRNCGALISDLWLFFTISTGVFAFLDTHSQYRFLQCCIVVYVDRSEVALGATELRLNFQLLSWGVPTPPVQAVAPQLDNAWDDFSLSSADFADSSDES